jgi:hypothetical protein
MPIDILGFTWIEMAVLGVIQDVYSD